MKLKRKSTDELLPAAITELIEKDFKKLKKDKRFSFNWDIEKEYEVYKIYLLSEDDKVLGLMSLIDIPEEYRIHLNLLEVSKENQGKEKEIDFIAGCLIAFAASAASKRGYYGFVSLEPKTKLIDLYQDKYGFRQYGRYLGIEGEASQSLIEKYLIDDEEGTDL
ncbi:MAG: hypothetical protein AAGG68_16555 [Bacteroidota bacterium]